MPGKVFFEVTMGALEGQVFTYEEADRVFVGRSDDCGVILPEKTVSRYHCLLNINPPTVKLQDFGSLNGTYLNEQIIGRRERTQTREEAGGEAHDEYELHDGDRIRLGKSCELRCRIELPAQDPDEDPDGTMVEPQDGGMTMPEPGRRMSPEDGEALKEAERLMEEARKETEAARAEAERLAAEAQKEAEAARKEAERQAEEVRKEAERQAEEARKEAEQKAKEEAAQKEAELRKEAEQRMAAALKEAAARREAEQKAEEARREAERKAEEARKEAERKKEAARKEAERKAEEARKEAERKKEAARREAERKAEEARKEAERKKEAARREAERLAEEARKEAERRAEEARKKKAEEEKQAAAMKPARRNCRGCGKLFTPTAPDNNLCTDCLKDQGKILDDILMALIGGALAQQGEKLEASPVEGYDKVGLLGKGGMGEVWKVREKKTGKILALKTMLPEIAADRKAKNMFLREAGICEFLKHKNVVRTYQTGCADGVFYILMDLCGGGSVEDLMKRSGGKLSLNLATYIILQVLDGLDYVHKLELTVEIKKKGLFGGKQTVNVKGVVHRDFKPGNIFLSDHSDHPVAMVADFGMAKAFETAGLTDMSAPGEAKGTVPFMPRQQVLDCRYAKPEVDVWAAAASYYNMLTGDFPKNLKPGPLLWQGLVTESAVPIRRRDPSIPAGVAQVIDQALIEKPQIGFQSAAEFRRKLAAALPADTKKYCKMLLR